MTGVYNKDELKVFINPAIRHRTLGQTLLKRGSISKLLDSYESNH